FAVVGDLDSNHQTESANLSDRRVLLLELAEAIHHVIAHVGGVFHHAILENLKRLHSGGYCNRISAKRRSVRPYVPSHQLFPRESHAERQPASDSFGHAHDVRHDAEVFHRPELSGSAHPRLNFIDDERDSMIITNSSKLRQEIRRRNDVTAFALDWFDYDGRAVFGCNGCFENSLLDVSRDSLADAFAFVASEREADRIRKRHVIHVESLRPEASTLSGARCSQRQCAEGPSVERSSKRDELVSPGCIHYSLEGAFHCFRPGVAVMNF